MALADITLADGQGTPVNHTFTYVGTQGSRIIRSEIAAAAEEPRHLSMAHSEAVKNGVRVRSHLVRFDITVLDTDGITPHTANIRVCADIPNPILSDALADNQSAFVRNLLTAAFWKAFVKGSVG